MHFTQEDYRKIETWLYQRAVRDTELPVVSSMNGDELVPILQDNKNKTIRFNDLVKKVADMKLSDFYNVTANSKKSYLTLKEAISLVPVEQRKLGLTISYHNECGNWVIYQFKGDSLNQWDSPNCWSSIIQQALEDLVVFPDEEDVTGVRDSNRTFLKFKNKEYNPEEFSGMGRVILRKNLVGTEACSIDDEDHYKNILTQDMVNQENTIYIVQYDFDLDGKTISIPKGCTLWFQGGSINNGTIYLQETPILGVFEFADMGDAKLFGKFNTGQIMTFSNNNYKLKEGKYFIPSTRPSSATPQEDIKRDSEVFYSKNPDAYTTRTRQELRWWNGEEWLLILDITDYQELNSIIYDLIEKHNAEMAASYKYFKKRIAEAEERLDLTEVRLNDIEERVENISGDISNINNELRDFRSSTTNLNNRVDNIQQSISSITNVINNLEQTISTYIQNYIETHVIGTTSITVNGETYTPDDTGNILLPNYPELGNATANESLTIMQGTSILGMYNGTKNVVVHIPSTSSTAGKVAHKLKITGVATAEYDGSSEVTVNIPSNEPDLKTLSFQSQSGTIKTTFNAKADKTIKGGSVLVKTNGEDKLHDAFDGNQTVIDLKPYINGVYNHPTILYAGEIVRTQNTTSWKMHCYHKHEGVGSVSFATSSALLKITLGANTGWTLGVATAVAVPRDLNDLAYNSADGSGKRSSGGWIQCATDASTTVYLHSWRTGDSNNDSVYPDCLNQGGKCLGISLVVIGYASKKD